MHGVRDFGRAAASDNAIANNPPDSRDRVLVRICSCRRLAISLSTSSASVSAQRVVDDVKPLQVDQHDRCHALPALRGVQVLAEAIFQKRAVG